MRSLGDSYGTRRRERESRLPRSSVPTGGGRRAGLPYEVKAMQAACDNLGLQWAACFQRNRTCQSCRHLDRKHLSTRLFVQSASFG